jgi:uncharacterized membrane protein YagU involved in acid resistance
LLQFGRDEMETRAEGSFMGQKLDKEVEGHWEVQVKPRDTHTNVVNLERQTAQQLGFICEQVCLKIFAEEFLPIKHRVLLNIFTLYFPFKYLLQQIGKSFCPRGV